MSRPLVRHRDEVPAVTCPCGQAQRVLTGADLGDCSLHLVAISQASRAHYHRRQSEVYVVMRGHGWIELDDDRRELREGTMVVIPPGTRHRAVPGEDGLTIVNLVRPPFDPEDEYHD